MSHAAAHIASVPDDHRPRADEAIREARKLQALGALAAGIAHELNTPAQYLGDNLRFLAGAFDQLAPLLRAVDRTQGVDVCVASDVPYLLEEVPSAVAQSIEGVAQIARLVGALRGFATARVDGPAQVHLNATIESVLTVARNEWKYVAEVVRELDPALPPVPCVPGELQQVVLSLLLEAVRATSAARGPSSPVGTIVVRTARVPGGVELSVTDAGEGDPNDARARILGPTNGDAALRAARPDLVLVRDLVVAEHRGGIDVEARPGQGITVRVRLLLPESTPVLR